MRLLFDACCKGEQRRSRYLRLVHLLISDSKGDCKLTFFDRINQHFEKTILQPSTSLIFPVPSQNKRQIEQMSTKVNDDSDLASAMNRKAARSSSCGDLSSPCVALPSIVLKAKTVHKKICQSSSTVPFASTALKQGRFGPWLKDSISSLLSLPMAGAKNKNTKESKPVCFENLRLNSAASFVLSPNDATFQTGVSVSFWVKNINNSGQFLSLNASDFHLFSIRGGTLLCSLSIIGGSRDLILDVKSEHHLVARKTLRKFLARDQWTHLILSCKLVRNEVLCVSIFSNVVQSEEASFSLHLECDWDARQLVMDFGCTRDQATSVSYLFGNLLVFSGMLDFDEVVLLKGFGPRCLTVVDTLSKTIEPILSSQMSPKLLNKYNLSSSLLIDDQEGLLENVQGLLEKVQQHLIAMYSPADATSLFLYRFENEGSKATIFNPHAVTLRHEICFFSDIIAHTEQCCIDDSVECLGGIKLLLFLFAKALEANLKKCVCSATKCIFLAIKRNPLWLCVFKQSNGLDMILHAMSLRPTIIDEDWLMELFGTLTSGAQSSGSKQIDLFDDDNNGPIIGLDLDLIIQDPESLVALLLCYDIWKNNLALWSHAIKTVDNFLLDAKFGLFNRQQLNAADFLKKLLFFLSELYQRSTTITVDEEELFVFNVNAIVSTFLYSPSVKEITLLWDFLFLSHPAASTYLSFKSPSTFNWIEPSLFSYAQKEVTFYHSALANHLIFLIENMPQGRVCLTKNRSSKKDQEVAWVSAEFTPFPLFAYILEDLLQLEHSKLFKQFLIYNCKIFNGHQRNVSLYVSTDCPIQCENDDSGRDSSTGGSFDLFAEIRAGFFQLLSNLLITIPDKTFARVMESVIKWKQVLVMLRQQKNENVRQYCVKILSIILIRFNQKDKLAFCKAHGFSLLSNLILEHPCTSGIMDALFSILLDATMRLDDGLDAANISLVPVDKYRTAALKPIFTALQRSINDTSLYWDTIGGLRKLFENNCSLSDVMLDYIPECLVNILLQLSEKTNKCNDIDGMNENDLLNESWLSFTTLFVQYTFNRFGLYYFQHLSSFLHLLFIADLSASTEKARDHSYVRNMLCSVMLTILDLVEEAAAESALPSTSKWSVSKQDNAKTATRTEILDRLKLILQYCADLFCFLPVATNELPIKEQQLFEKLISFCCQCVSIGSRCLDTSDSDTVEFKMSYRAFFSGCSSKIRQILIQMFTFYLYPAHQKNASIDNRATQCESLTIKNMRFNRRLFIIACLSRHFDEQTWKIIFDSTTVPFIVCKMAVIISLMEIRMKELASTNEVIENDIKGACEACYENARKAAQVPTPLDELKLCSNGFRSCDFRRLLDAERKILTLYDYEKRTFLEKLQQFSDRLVQQNAKSAKAVSSAAMAVTCSTVEEQNLPRKLFIRYKRQMIAQFSLARANWKLLVDDLCHPEASCFDERHWPKNWSLDFTEGSRRERKRLVPCHLRIPRRFLRESNFTQTALCSQLSYLLEPSMFQNSQGSQETPPIDTYARFAADQQLKVDEKLIFTCPGTIIRPSFECYGELLLGDYHLHFAGQSSRTTQKGIPCEDILSLSWSYQDFVEIYRRYFQLADRAIEFFLADGETYMVAFETQEQREHFLHRLLQMGLQNLILFAENSLQTVSQWWRDGNLTNFEYLMHVNKFAGRTFNDLMQYPVFPFILSDYVGLTLDLNNYNSYRNLSKPIAIQSKLMEHHYREVYKSLENDYQRAQNEGRAPSLPFLAPYNYSSHYSNSGIVIHFLVRLPPFTQMALEYQDNSFDMPDRLFHSMAATWRLSSFESTSDFKELIPEFFILPEFLINSEGLNLGEMQNGRSVDDVELPAWCPENDPRLFIMVHRQALESDYVTSNLHNWIDLIFGYKQTGQPAIEAINVFHPVTYHGADIATSSGTQTDDLQSNAISAMVRTYGQMPRQLFKTPHLPHSTRHQSNAQLVSKGPILSVNGLKWGSYVGSPDESEPVLILKQRSHGENKPYSMLYVADGSVLCFPRMTLPVVIYKAAKQSAPVAISREVQQVFGLSWKFGDSVVRSKLYGQNSSAPWRNLFSIENSCISSACSYPGTKTCCFGTTIGVILVYVLELSDQDVKSYKLVRTLYGHKTNVRSLFASWEYNTLVSCDEEGLCLIWDLNRLRFIRALTRQTGPVNACVVSKSCGEISTSCINNVGSRLSLHAINGKLIGSISVNQKIISLAMSSADEGISINCIAAGLQNGVIRFWETWTLSHLRDIAQCPFQIPVTSLCFAQNSTKLYACMENGAILCWESGQSINGARQLRPCRFTFVG